MEGGDDLTNSRLISLLFIASLLALSFAWCIGGLLSGTGMSSGGGFL